jgi:outer membrane immunogenic protein
MTRGFGSLTIIGGLLASCLTVSCLTATGARAASPAPAETGAFSGPWIGVYGGYGWGNPGGVWTLSGGGLDPYPVVLNALNAAGSNTIGANGPLFGLQGGWNWRLPSNIVLGVEADVGRYAIHGDAAAAGTVPIFQVPFTINQSYSLDWQAALRLRGGFAFNDFALVYVEAGPALANLHYSSYFWDNATAAGFAFDESEFKSLQAVKVGLSLGAGVEFALTNNLSVSAAYQYSHFPSLTGSGTSVLDPPFTTANVAHSSGALNQSAFRLGLNYYFK